MFFKTIIARAFPFWNRPTPFFPRRCASCKLERSPMRLATRGAMGSCSSSRANHQTCLQGNLFSDFSASQQQLLVGSLRGHCGFYFPAATSSPASAAATYALPCFPVPSFNKCPLKIKIKKDYHRSLFDCWIN